MEVSESDLKVCDALIGMDVISLGDMKVTNKPTTKFIFRESGSESPLASAPKHGARSCFLTSGRDSASPLTVDLFGRLRFGLAGHCPKLAAFVSDTRRMFWLVVVVFLLLAFGGIALYEVSRPSHYDFDEFFPPNEEVLR